MIPLFYHIKLYLANISKIGRKQSSHPVPPFLGPGERCCTMSPLGLSALTAADNLWELYPFSPISLKPLKAFSYLLSTSFVPGTVFRAWGKAVNKMKRQSLSFYALHILLMKTDNKYEKQKLTRFQIVINTVKKIRQSDMVKICWWTGAGWSCI